MRAIIHIGLEKTGTTSIQKAFVRNRSHLNACGFHYSELCGGSGRHDFLPFIAARHELSDYMGEAVDLFGPREHAESKVRGMLSAEKQKVAAHKIMVFSSEGCHRALFTTECVQRLRHFLKDFFDHVDIIIYLRRQDRIAISAYSTHLRMGGTSTDPFHYDRGILEYEHLMYRWTSVFGKEAVHAYTYDDINISIVRHFADAIGVRDFPDDCHENLRLTPIEQSLMQLVNHQLGPFDGNAIRSAISFTCSRMSASLRSNVTREVAVAYMQQFLESNERVRGGYFPSKQSLFDDDFSEYPEELLTQSEALTALAINSLAEGGKIIADLEQQIRVLRAIHQPAPRQPNRLSHFIRRLARNR